MGGETVGRAHRESPAIEHRQADGFVEGVQVGCEAAAAADDGFLYADCRPDFGVDQHLCQPA